MPPWHKRTWQRHHAIILLFLLLSLGLLIRLLQLQFFQKDFLLAKGEARTVQTISISTYRGLITDRNGRPLAVSTPVNSVWANPKIAHLNEDRLTQLAQILNLESTQLKARLQQFSHKEFIYLKRMVPPQTSQKIKNGRFPGVGLTQEFRRYYPASASVAQLVGFTNIDDQGLAGLELSYDATLKPTLGKKKVLRDRQGHWVKDLQNIQMPKPGQDLTLSIDLRIQNLAYTALTEALETYQAKSATCVMIDIPTGEILAMLSAPSFNPNHPKSRTGAKLRNRALTDQIEPGSTIKPFTLASALKSQEYQLSSIVDTSPGKMQVGNHIVRDERNNGKLSLKEILTKSSNVGVAKVALSLPAENLISDFKQFGFGNVYLPDYPGAIEGKLPLPPKDPFVHSTLAFGYALTVTPLQLANAYGILGRKGTKLPLTLLKHHGPTPTGPKVIDAQTAQDILTMLTDNIQTGTGKRAKIPGYLTAGKTGTIRIVGPQGYDPNRHKGLFVGISPVKHPRLATVVIIEEPKESRYYGGLVAAPVYAKIVSGALHILNEPLDSPGY